MNVKLFKMPIQSPSFLKPISVIKSYDIPAIKRAKEIIESNLSDHWTLGLLAAKAGTNEFKLKLGFKLLFNESPYQYLLKLRLERATVLLQETDLALKQIADRTGFESLRGFSKSFKKHYKMSPKEYRCQNNRFVQPFALATAQ